MMVKPEQTIPTDNMTNDVCASSASFAPKRFKPVLQFSVEFQSILHVKSNICYEIVADSFHWQLVELTKSFLRINLIVFKHCLL